MSRRFCAWVALVGYVISLTGCGGAPGNPQGQVAPSATATPEDKSYAAPAPEAALHDNAALQVEALRFAETEGLPASQAAEARDQGQGPGLGGDKYDLIVENSFVPARENPLSTFSIDVDTASYSKTRMYLMQENSLPPVDAVRIEELINYFDYAYSGPADEHPFAVHVEVTDAPWKPGHRLARIGLKGREIEKQRPSTNLVFLIDVSGSMDYPNKLPLVKQGLQMLTSQLGENDRVSIVVYAGAAGLVLPPTHGDDRQRIVAALDRLHAGGSTNGGAGIRLAYQLARENLIVGGVNRVILCSDGDFNVGTTSTGELVRLAEQEAKAGVFLTVLGFGMGNHNDAMMEELSNKANGNYAFIDTPQEAYKVLCEQVQSTLVTIAKDVKIQVEFNPSHVAAYRLIGYENRHLEAQDFNDDRKDAGEIGAGHTVTALYEFVPGGEGSTVTPSIDPLKYQTQQAAAAGSGELMTVKLRYKQPDSDVSRKLEVAVQNAPVQFSHATPDLQFASAVAEFGMLLRNSENRGDASYNAVLEIAQAARGEDRHGYRAEFLQLVTAAQRLSGEPVRAASLLPAYVPTQPAIAVPAYNPPLQPPPRVVYVYKTAAVDFWTIGMAIVLGVSIVALVAVIAGVIIACRYLVLRPDEEETWEAAWPCTATQRAVVPAKPPVRQQSVGLA